MALAVLTAVLWIVAAVLLVAEYRSIR
jgi:hypothetical protein